MPGNTPHSRLVDSLRVTDQETARVIAVLDHGENVVGAGTLVDERYVLSCAHVVSEALGKKAAIDDIVIARLVGTRNQLTQTYRVRRLGREDDPRRDLVLLERTGKHQLSVVPIEFSAPLRHNGKQFSVLGFPDFDAAGRNVRGLLHACDAQGLVQMDSQSAMLVQGGFSGAPVWSADLQAFVGLVVSEHSEASVAWCIPSRLLAVFCPGLLVRFRVAPQDRPTVHDYEEDDPNIQFFGVVSDNGARRLTATVKWLKKKGKYKVNATYTCLKGSPRPLGGYVTFITHPSFTRRTEDAFELFSRVGRRRTAITEFYPYELFTMAAIGDCGDTALTLNLAELEVT